MFPAAISDAEFNLGEFLGIGLTTAELGYLAGALFLGLFGLAALRRVRGGQGFAPVIWIAIAFALFAGCLLVTARGFPDQIPESLRPWTVPRRLVRAAAILALVFASLYCLSAHWLRGAIARWLCRVGGLCTAGIAMWLAVGWFADDVPADVLPWTADAVISHAVLVLSVLFLAGTFWVRETGGKPHNCWANRALSPIAFGVAIILGLRWFGDALPSNFDTSTVERTTIVSSAIAFATCLLIAGGAYLLREKPRAERQVATPSLTPIPLVVNRSLPVALLLDERGQPILPKSDSNQSGPRRS